MDFTRERRRPSTGEFGLQLGHCTTFDDSQFLRCPHDSIDLERADLLPDMTGPGWRLGLLTPEDEMNVNTDFSPVQRRGSNSKANLARLKTLRSLAQCVVAHNVLRGHSPQPQSSTRL